VLRVWHPLGLQAMRNHGRLGSADPDELALALLAHLQGGLLKRTNLTSYYEDHNDSADLGSAGNADLAGLRAVPRAPLGPAAHDQGYNVRHMEQNLYWVTNGDYHSAFLATPDGVVLFDAPPTIGHNLQRAVNEVAAAEGVSNTVTHLVYTHPPLRPCRRVLGVRHQRGGHANTAAVRVRLGRHDGRLRLAVIRRISRDSRDQ
jgi:hypothetical protein